MIRIVKFAIAFVVWSADRVVDALSRWLRREGPPFCVAIYYHRVAASQAGRFRRQMDELLRRTVPLPATLETPPAGSRMVGILTFDDGFADTVRVVQPILREKGIPSAWFVPAGHLGQVPLWIRDDRQRAEMGRILSNEQIRSLAADPLVTIGSHGMSHMPFTGLTFLQTKEELSTSRARLAEAAQRDVTLFSFPYGAHWPIHLEQAREEGYKRVFTVYPDPALTSANEFATGRIRVDPSDWSWEFRMKIMGAYRWIAFATRTKQKVLEAVRGLAGRRSDGPAM